MFGNFHIIHSLNRFLMVMVDFPLGTARRISIQVACRKYMYCLSRSCATSWVSYVSSTRITRWCVASDVNVGLENPHENYRSIMIDHQQKTIVKWEL